ISFRSRRARTLRSKAVIERVLNGINGRPVVVVSSMPRAQRRADGCAAGGGAPPPLGSGAEIATARRSEQCACPQSSDEAARNRKAGDRGTAHVHSLDVTQRQSRTAGQPDAVPPDTRPRAFQAGAGAKEDAHEIAALQRG